MGKLTKNSKLWVYVITLVGLISLFIFNVLNYNQPIHFKQVNLSKDNIVINKTERPYLDSIVKVGLDELGIKKVNVMIHTLEPNYRSEDTEFKAIIRNQGNQYGIWIKDIDKLESIDVISHELIHLMQYYYNDLNIDPQLEYVTFKGEDYYLEQVPYYIRPWEKEAREQGKELSDVIKIRLIEK